MTNDWPFAPAAHVLLRSTQKTLLIVLILMANTDQYNASKTNCLHKLSYTCSMFVGNNTKAISAVLYSTALAKHTHHKLKTNWGWQWSTDAVAQPATTTAGGWQQQLPTVVRL